MEWSEGGRRKETITRMQSICVIVRRGRQCGVGKIAADTLL